MIKSRSAGYHLALSFALASAVFVPQVVLAADDTPPPTAASAGVLVNLTTPEIVGFEQASARADLRSFAGADNTVYINGGLQYGIARNWQLGFAGSFSKFQTYAMPGGGTLRYAGSDLELTGKYATKMSGKYSLSGQVGLSFPNTPAQKSTHLTLGASAGVSPVSNFNVYLNPRAVLITNNSLFGLGLGATFKMSSTVTWFAEYTQMLAGSNTIDINTGDLKTRGIYGVGVRYLVANHKISVDLGWTNGLGFTTGSSLTPGIGDSSAWYAAINFKQ